MAAADRAGPLHNDGSQYDNYHYSDSGPNRKMTAKSSDMKKPQLIFSDAVTLTVVAALIINATFVGWGLIGTAWSNIVLVGMLVAGLSWLLMHRKTTRWWLIRSAVMIILAGYVAFTGVRRMMIYRLDKGHKDWQLHVKYLSGRQGEIDRWLDSEMKRASSMQEPQRANQRANQRRKIRAEYDQMEKEFHDANNLGDPPKSGQSAPDQKPGNNLMP